MHASPHGTHRVQRHAMLVAIWGDGVFKLLLLIAMGFVVLALFRAYQRSLGRPPSSEQENTVEDMVKCAHCGVNLPRSEAIYSGGNFFCTPEHKQLGRK